MNRPLRRVAAACLALFALLLVQANWVQVIKAKEYRDDPRNRRVLLRTYDRERGPIVVGAGKDRQAVAVSRATDGTLKYLRTYPGGPSYAPITGFASLVYGFSGTEKLQDPILSGDDDRLFVRRLSDYITGRKISGGSVLLTINRAAQQAAYDALAGKVGAIVALDPSTGAVLAMATRPSYDPTVLSSHDPKKIREEYQRLLGLDLSPLTNRAVERTYAPGSTFKLITAAAALSNGVAQPETLIPAPTVLTFRNGKPLRNFAGETCAAGGKQTLAAALATSCNTAFGALGIQVGQDDLVKQANAFGFGSNDLRLPQPVADSRVLGDDTDLADPFLAQSAIGQYNVQASPLEMAMVAAGIANRGEVMTPYLVDQVQGPDLKQLDRTSPSVLSRAVSPSVAAQLTAMMEGVVSRGTGTRAAISGVRVAGKTGTAQGAAGADPNAWFVGFAPADDPKVAICVFLDRASGLGPSATGGTIAAPMAAAVMRAVLGR